MKLAQAGELSLVAQIRKRFSRKASAIPGLLLGIGDDAAVVRPRANSKLLLTTDMMVEDVHFNMRWTTPYQLGHKLVSVNVSDIYAMGGRPEYVLLNFSAPPSFELAKFNSFFDGLEHACINYGIHVIGGDISSSDKIVLSATLVGSASRVLQRSGASPGDFIHISGYLGDSAAGLAILRNLRKPVCLENNVVPKTQLPWEMLEPLIRRHLMPQAVDPGGFVRHATAMIDISDGLLVDLERLCKESKAGARIWADKIPLSPGLVQVARLFKRAPLDFALSGGEDYQLLFTSASRSVPGSVCIGEIVRTGIRVIGPEGRQMKISSKGYEHFGV